MTDALFLDPERIKIQQWLPLVSLVFLVFLSRQKLDSAVLYVFCQAGYSLLLVYFDSKLTVIVWKECW